MENVAEWKSKGKSSPFPQGAQLFILRLGAQEIGRNAHAKQQPAVVADLGAGCKSADNKKALMHMTLSHIPSGCRE